MTAEVITEEDLDYYVRQLEKRISQLEDRLTVYEERLYELEATTDD